MTTLGVINIYDAIKRSNGQYCKLCFRNADERKLVNPVSLKQFLNAVDRSSFCKESMKVCYVCEARAASALRVCHAVALAAALEELFAWLDQGVGLRRAVLDYLEGKHKSGGRACRRAAQCEAALRRAGAGLGRSDTLVVAADVGLAAGGAPAAQPDTRTDTDNLQWSRGPVGGAGAGAAAREEPAGVRRVAELREHMGLGVRRVAVLREHMRLGVPDPRTGQFLLHPMVQGSDGNIYVPSLKLQLAEGDKLKSVSDQHLLLYTNTPLPVQTNRQTNAPPVQTAHTDPPVGDYQNFLNQRSELKNACTTTDRPNTLQNILNYGLNIKLGPRNIQYGPRNVQPVPRNAQRMPRNVQHVTRKTQRDPSKVQRGASECERGASAPARRARPAAGGMTETKRPVMSIERVDWENKIPMDVISFMDATDPNPSERIMQPEPLPPLAVISDVRTEPDAHADDDVLLVDSHVECIDLC